MSLLKKHTKADDSAKGPENGYRNQGSAAAIPQEIFAEYTTTGLLAEEFAGVGYELISMADGSAASFTKEKVLVGCMEDRCDFVIAQDPKNHKVSREHAYLFIMEGKVFVKDISGNGTFLGSPDMAEKDMFRLPKDTEVEVRDGQILRFADKSYQLRYLKTV